MPEPPQIEAGKLNADICREMLSEAQAVVATQISASNNLSSNLTAILGQAITLAIAVLGAAALVFPTGSSGASWMPLWGAVGLAVAGGFWVVTAIAAALGIRPRDFQFGFSPRELSVPEVLAPASAAEAYLYIALQMQPVIDFNAGVNSRLARQVVTATLLFITSPVLGILAAGLTAWAAHPAAR